MDGPPTQKRLKTETNEDQEQKPGNEETAIVSMEVEQPTKEELAKKVFKDGILQHPKWCEPFQQKEPKGQEWFLNAMLKNDNLDEFTRQFSKLCDVMDDDDRKLVKHLFDESDEILGAEEKHFSCKQKEAFKFIRQEIRKYPEWSHNFSKFRRKRQVEFMLEMFDQSKYGSTIAFENVCDSSGRKGDSDPAMFKALFAMIIEIRNLLADAVSRAHDAMFGLEENYQGSLEALSARIDEVFDWFKEDHLGRRNCLKVMAPCFPIIQSSGMGKTRMMKEYVDKMNKIDDDVQADISKLTATLNKGGKDNTSKHLGKMDASSVERRRRAVLILCTDSVSGVPRKFSEVYHETLYIGDDTRTESHQCFIRNQLASLRRYGKEAKELVIMFDESQRLVDKDDGLAMSVIQWWLRTVENNNPRCVAVFAGTASKLSERYEHYSARVEYIARAPATRYLNFRDAEYGYRKIESPERRYSPFYHLTTMACIKDNEQIGDALAPVTTEEDMKCIEYVRAAYYGRPLFALLMKGSPSNDEWNSSIRPYMLNMRMKAWRGGVATICNGPLFAVTKRMLLISNGSDRELTLWSENEDSIYSVLGTRVQLGVAASYALVSKVVGEGYGNLTELFDDERVERNELIRGTIVGTRARLAFLPDPVCATLAMGLMCNDWGIYDSPRSMFIEGRKPSFWIESLGEILSNGMFLPEKGDFGEIMAALLMLFIGDAIRHRNFPYMLQYSVSLVEWLDELKKAANPNASTNSGARSASKTAQGNTKASLFSVSSDATINCIQICRNHFRSHGWLTQEGLRLMYNSAIGCYTYENCEKFDIVTPIRICSESGEVSYHPLLVSVQCRKHMSTRGVKTHLEEMKGMVDWMFDNMASPLKGSKRPSALFLLLLIGCEVLGGGDEETSVAPPDMGHFPEHDGMVCKIVSGDDKYGISGCYDKVNSRHGMSEIYASHAFAKAECLEDALRGCASEEEKERARLIFNNAQESD